MLIHTTLEKYVLYFRDKNFINFIFTKLTQHTCNSLFSSKTAGEFANSSIRSSALSHNTSSFISIISSYPLLRFILSFR